MMASVRKDPDPRVVPIPIENLGRVVRRPIVEDDQLPVGEHLRSNALQGIREESAVVVAEDVDAHGRGGLECQDTLLDSLQDANDARASLSGSSRMSQRVAFRTYGLFESRRSGRS